MKIHRWNHDLSRVELPCREHRDAFAEPFWERLSGDAIREEVRELMLEQREVEPLVRGMQTLIVYDLQPQEIDIQWSLAPTDLPMRGRPPEKSVHHRAVLHYMDVWELVTPVQTEERA